MRPGAVPGNSGAARRVKTVYVHNPKSGILYPYTRSAGCARADEQPRPHCTAALLQKALDSKERETESELAEI